MSNDAMIAGLYTASSGQAHRGRWKTRAYPHSRWLDMLGVAWKGPYARVRLEGSAKQGYSARRAAFRCSPDLIVATP